MLSAVLITVCSLGINVKAISFKPSFEIRSESVYLVNLGNKEVVYEQNADKLQSPGSLAQIMTAVVVLENCDNPEEETITANNDLYTEFDEYEYPDDLRYADIYDGDKLSVSDYLYALMLTSSCEAANILADYFGKGDISAFVSKMNAKAADIGCTDTVFTNPHGLYDKSQVTTAKDLALITEYALTVPGFEEIATTEEHQLKPLNPGSEHEDEWSISHSNSIMSPASDFYLYGVKGIKTANLDEGGRSLVTMGSSEGIKYLLVTLNAPLFNEDGESRYYHMMDGYNIMEWVFNNFGYRVLLNKDEEMGEIKVAESDGSGYVLIKPDREVSSLWYNEVDTTSITKNITLAKDVVAPVKKGQKLGEIELKLGDELIDVVDLVAATDVDRSFLRFNLSVAKDFFVSRWFVLALAISAVLAVIYTAVCIWAYRDYKLRARGSFSNKKIVKKLYGNNRRR